MAERVTLLGHTKEIQMAEQSNDQANKQTNDQANGQAQDVVQLWREWLTLSERQFNGFFNEVMGSDQFARSAAGYMETFAASQRLLAQGMERYLSFVNMPSRNDIASLAETLQSIETRLAQIEETLQLAAEAVDGSPVGAPSREEPKRTRQPAGAQAAEESDTEQSGIPANLRRQA